MTLKELKDLDQEFLKLATEISNDTDQLNKDKLKLERLKKIFQSYKLEIKSVKNKTEYESKIIEYDNIIKKLSVDLNDMTTIEILDKAESIQNESIKSLDRDMIYITEMKSMGNNIVNNQKEQNDKLAHVDDELNVIQIDLKSVGKEISSFSRRIATDKCLWLGGTIISFLFLIVAIYTILSGFKQTKLPDFVGNVITTSKIN